MSRIYKSHQGFTSPSGVRRYNKKAGAGFTLLELLITLVLVSSLVGAIWVVYNAGFRAFYSQETRSRIKAEAGRFLINLSRELRQASSLSAAEGANISFSLDSDDDGLEEAVQYIWAGLAGSPLQRVSSYTVTAVKAVNNLAFSYYDADNNLLSLPATTSLVRLVAVDLTVSDKDETFQLRSEVRLRNL